MTSYVAIPDNNIDQDSPITQPLMTALRDNPISIAEGANGAPYMQTAWHPYNGLLVGDGNTGRIYNEPTDGAVTNITTPDFETGYDYQIVLASIDSGLGSFGFRFSVFCEAGAAWAIWVEATQVSPTAYTNMKYISTVINPMTTASGFYSSREGNVDPRINIASDRLLRMKFEFISTNITGGKAYLYRRRNYGLV